MFYSQIFPIMQSKCNDGPRLELPEEVPSLCVLGNSWKKSLADWQDLALKASSCQTFSPSLPFWTIQLLRFAKAKGLLFAYTHTHL